VRLFGAAAVDRSNAPNRWAVADGAGAPTSGQ